MRISKKLFPYPIINSDTNRSTFRTSLFNLECEDIIQTKDECILKNVYFHLNNSMLLDYIKQKLVRVVCVVECSSSLFRKEYELIDLAQDIVIPLYELKDNVVVSSFAIATEKIQDFNDVDFDEDYKGYQFTLERHDIVAADDGFSFKVDYEEEADNKLSSIFKIIKQSDDDLLVKITPSNKKIFIYLPESQFNQYDVLKTMDSVKDTIFSMLIIPALIIAIDTIKSNISENRDLDDLSLDFSWLKSLMNRYKEVFSKEPIEDDFKDMNSLEVAQALVDYPMIKGIKSLHDLSFKRPGDEIDD